MVSDLHHIMLNQSLSNKTSSDECGLMFVGGQLWEFPPTMWEIGELLELNVSSTVPSKTNRDNRSW